MIIYTSKNKNQENKKLKFDIKMLEKKQIEILVFKEKVKRYKFLFC
jgi:hypothetical protein